MKASIGDNKINLPLTFELETQKPLDVINNDKNNNDNNKECTTTVDSSMTNTISCKNITYTNNFQASILKQSNFVNKILVC